MTLFICIILSFLALLAALTSMAMTLQAWHNRELGRVWKCGVTYGKLLERFDREHREESETSLLERDPDWWKKGTEQ